MDCPGKAPKSIFSILAMVSLALVAAGCNLPPSFGPEYRDTTTNFMAAHSLLSPTEAMDSMGGTALDPFAAWDWSWRGRTDNLYVYMSLSKSGPSTAPGNIGDEWLLSAENLAADPVCASGTAWSAVAAATATIISGADAINGSTLQISIPNNKTDYASIVSSFFDDSDAKLKNYRISFNVRYPGYVRFKSFFGSYNSDSLQNPNWSANGRYLLPASESEGFGIGSAQYLAFSGSSGTGYSLDDIQAIRSDIDVRKWSLSIRLRANDTIPALAPGVYEFSIWVRTPTGYYFSDDPTRGDDPHYAAKNLTLRMFNITKNTSVAEQTFPINSYGVWTRLILQMPSGKSLDFSEDDPSQILELSISPMSPQWPDAGAVLIADPQLRYYINGY